MGDGEQERNSRPVSAETRPLTQLTTSASRQLTNSFRNGISIGAIERTARDDRFGLLSTQRQHCA